MSVILKGRVSKLEVGVDANNHADVTNLVYARWSRVHEVTPSTVSGTKVPDHWHQGHSWVTFEIGILGYNTAFTTQAVDGSGNKAYDEDGDSFPCGYFMISYETAPASGSPTTKTTSFDHAIVATMDIDLRDSEDPVTVVRGLAFYKTDA